MIKVYKQNSPVFENVKDLGIYSDGRNLESYKFYGSSKQTGTPTPSSPVTVEEFGEKTGNLFYSKIDSAGIGSTGKIISDQNYTTYIAHITQGQTYRGNGTVYAFYGNEPALNSASYDNTRTVGFSNFIAPITGYVAVRYPVGGEAMINEGSTALPYEPYGKYKIPITSAGQTQNIILTEPLRKIGNYADSVDSEGVVTRKIKKLVLDGTENWDIYSSGDTHFFYMSLSPLGLPSITYNVDPISNSFSSCKILRVSDNEQTLRCYDRSTFNSVSDFTTWLATQYANGTPVTVYYVLATAVTESTTAPTIPTSSGYSNITIDTSLAPSKVELNIGEMWMNSQLYKYMENSGAIENSKEFQIYNNKNNIDNYLIEGKCSQVSTPTPSSPTEVKQVGEKTVNLYNDSTTTDGYRIYWNNGEPYADTNAATSDYISVKPETTYSLSASTYIAGYDSNKTYLGTWSSSGWTKSGGGLYSSIITTNDCYYLKLVSYNKTTIHNNFMLNEGSTALSYEPYGMYKIPITSNNTTQNLILTEPLRKIGSYIDTIDSNGVITRQIKKYVFNGEETWKLSSGNLFCNIIDNTAATSKTVISSHFTSTSTSGLYVSVGEYRLKLFSSSFPSGVTTAAEMQTWVATQYTNGTPLTVYYILSTPIIENTSPNIIPSAAQQTLTSNGITLTSNGKGTYTLNGTSTSFTSFDLLLPNEFTIPTSISQGGNGAISFFNDFGIANCSIGFLYNEEVVDFISLDVMNKATNSYIGIGDKKVNGIRINIASDLTFSNAVISPMVSWSGNYPVNFKEYQSPVKFLSVVGNNGIVIETELEPSKFSYNLGPMWMPQRIFRYQQNTATVENSKTIPIYSNGSNLTEYSFEGQCSQASTPTPSSPVEVQEFGNYISQSTIDNILTNTTLTITEPTPTVSASGTGRVTIIGTRAVPENSGLTIVETGFIYVKDVSNTDALTLENANDTASIVAKSEMATTNGSKTVNFTDQTGTGVRVVVFAIVTDGTYTITIYTEEAKATYQELKDEQEQGITVSHLYPGPANVTHVGEYQIPISSNGTKQFIYLSEPLRKIGNYADSVDSEDVVTRRIKKLVLDGTENWTNAGISGLSRMSIALSDAAFVRDSICSHYIYDPDNLNVNNHCFITSTLNTFMFCDNANANSLSNWTTFLAQQYANNTPVTVYYILATPTTESYSKNIFTPAAAQTATLNGVTCVSDGQGRYSLSGTASAVTLFEFIVPEFTVPESIGNGGTGTFSIFNDFTQQYVSLHLYNGSTKVTEWSCNSQNRTSTTYSEMSNNKVNKIVIRVAEGVAISGTAHLSPMITNDSTLPSTFDTYRVMPTIPTSSGFSNIEIGTSLAPSKFTYDLGKMFIPI